MKIYQLQKAMTAVYGILPIIAGADKFFNALTSWEKYLGAATLKRLPVSGTTFMHAVGIIEILAGIIVFLRPLTGAYIVMLWLILIAGQLIFTTSFYDIAVRDLIIAFGVFVFISIINITKQGRARAADAAGLPVQ